ncbi:uncharacterized protein IL334_007604 [Kwoniella shivajii]|uniref:Uncharacterized protein n=1 Tax=Kwoniella shivajii TaxID=564305 RepID=A0ABZ1D9X6_9TREE|nr:hypothetical protein IL334_007604 [Kwoniella shivajii]
MISKANKRVYSSITSDASSVYDNSPFAYNISLPLADGHGRTNQIPQVLQQQQQQQQQQHSYHPSPFTSHPLPYPPPGTIIAPGPVFQQNHYARPFSSSGDGTGNENGKEIQFIYETGRKEPKIPRKTKSNKRADTGRKVLANKTTKDLNLSTRARPVPLDLKKPTKLPSLDDYTSHMPSPPPTARAFTLPILPKISIYNDEIRHPSPLTRAHQLDTAYNTSPNISMDPSGPLCRAGNDYWRSEVYRNSYEAHTVSSPLPIDAPIPKAPHQAYTPFFEDALMFHNHDADGEYEMDLDDSLSSSNVVTPTEGLGIGLGLDLGERRVEREMMNFVPMKPSVDVMMDHSDTEEVAGRSGNALGIEW